jgi:glutathione S-transferase
MPAKLYVVHGSHPCRAVARALEIKGVPFKAVEYPPPLHAPVQRLRFGGRTVPSIIFEGGEKLSGSVAIMHRLEELVPEPPLYPSDPDQRAAVLEAERWGDEVLQPIGRRVLWPALGRNPRAMPSYLEGSTLPKLPGPVVVASAPLIVRTERRLNDATDEALRADLGALPSHLDHVDALIADGVIGGEPPNGADLQIVSTLRLLMTVADIRPLIEGRPAGELTLRLFPHHQGEIPAGTLPAEWLPQNAPSSAASLAS